MTPKAMLDRPATSPIARPAAGLQRWLPLVALLALVAAGYALGLHSFLTLTALAEHRDALKQWVAERMLLALACYMLIYIAVVALSLPVAAALSIAGGLLFGWMASVPATVVAAVAGSIIVFAVVKTSFGAALAERSGPFVQRLSKGFAENAFSLLLFLRLTPVFPFWAVNAVAGLTRMPLGTFVAATAIGIIPGSIAFALVGAGLDKTIDAQLAAHQACLAAGKGAACQFSLDPSALLSPELSWGFAGLGLIALLPLVWRRWRTSAP